MPFWRSFKWNNQTLKISSGSRVIPENAWKKAKTGFRKNAIIPKPIKIFNLKFDTTILKMITVLCWNFEFVSF